MYKRQVAEPADLPVITVVPDVEEWLPKDQVRDMDSGYTAVVEPAELSVITVVPDLEERLPKDQVRDMDSGCTAVVQPADLPVISVVPDMEERLPEDHVRDVDSGYTAMVELDDLPVITVVPDVEERLPEDQVRDMDSSHMEMADSSDSGVLNPLLVDVVQDREERIPEDSVRVDEEVASGNKTGVNVVQAEVERLSEDPGGVVVNSGSTEMENTDGAGAVVLNPGIPDGDKLQPFTSQSELPVIILVQDDEEHWPEDRCKEDSVEVVGLGNTETADDDGDVMASNHAASVSEALHGEVESFSDPSENKDEIRTCDVVNTSTDVDGIDGSSDTMAELEKTFAVFSETLSRTLECERSSSADDGSDTVLTNSGEDFARDFDSFVGYAKSISQASSVSRGSSEEFLATSSHYTRPVVEGAFLYNICV